jgi:F-box domain
MEVPAAEEGRSIIPLHVGLSDLPEEVWVLILQNLPVPDLFRCSMVRIEH